LTLKLPPRLGWLFNVRIVQPVYHFSIEDVLTGAVTTISRVVLLRLSFVLLRLNLGFLGLGLLWATSSLSGSLLLLLGRTTIFIGSNFGGLFDRLLGVRRARLALLRRSFGGRGCLGGSRSTTQEDAERRMGSRGLPLENGPLQYG
jgi:hypothetical protein